MGEPGSKYMGVLAYRLIFHSVAFRHVPKIVNFPYGMLRQVRKLTCHRSTPFSSKRHYGTVSGFSRAAHATIIVARPTGLTSTNLSFCKRRIAYLLKECWFIGLELTAISCASYFKFSRYNRKATLSTRGRLTVLAKLNLLNAFSVSEVVVSSNGRIIPGFNSIRTYCHPFPLVASRK